MHTQSDTVLSLLESIELPATSKTATQSALQLLLTNWSENVDVFQGYWNLRVSTVALTQLFISSRASLDQIRVRGDMLITVANSNSKELSYIIYNAQCSLLTNAFHDCSYHDPSPGEKQYLYSSTLKSHAVN